MLVVHFHLALVMLWHWKFLQLVISGKPVHILPKSNADVAANHSDDIDGKQELSLKSAWLYCSKYWLVQVFYYDLNLPCYITVLYYKLSLSFQVGRDIPWDHIWLTLVFFIKGWIPCLSKNVSRYVVSSFSPFLVIICLTLVFSSW